MRGMKCRAWHNEQQKMYQCYSVNFRNGQCGLEGFGMELRERLELLWFTGLRDKNSKEIYEGDIVKIIHVRHDVYAMIGRVVYVAPNYWIQGDRGGTDHWVGEWLEILGNIHQQPGLLETEHE